MPGYFSAGKPEGRKPCPLFRLPLRLKELVREGGSPAQAAGAGQRWWTALESHKVGLQNSSVVLYAGPYQALRLGLGGLSLSTGATDGTTNQAAGIDSDGLNSSSYSGPQDMALRDRL